MVLKINRIALYVIVALGALLTIFTIANPTDSIINAFILLAYILFGVAIVAAIGGSLLKAVTNPKNIKGSLIGLGVIVVITIISYALASDEVLKSYGDITASSSRWSEAGLFMLYILFALAVLAIIYSNISKSLK